MSEASNILSVKDLPYPVLQSGGYTQIQIINKLSNIIGVSPTFFSSSGQNGIDALVGTIMYRHLNRIQKIDVMTTIHNLPSCLATQALVGKITDILVQPDWGLWSLSNEELLQKKELHLVIDQYATWLGACPRTTTIQSVL